MKEINDGGPAFGEFEKCGDLAVRAGGLSKRDYFAAKAMQGLMASKFKGTHQAFAEHALKMSDAMIGEGSK